MAQRRMISKAIVETGRFAELSVLAQLMYLRMIVIADDDGFADTFALEKMLEVDESVCGELVEAGYIRKAPGKKYLYHISDWRSHNAIQRTKYHQSLYWDMLPDMYSPVEYKALLPAWLQHDRHEESDEFMLEMPELSTDNAPSDGVVLDSKQPWALSENAINVLLSKGFKKWTRGDTCRLYYNGGEFNTENAVYVDCVTGIVWSRDKQDTYWRSRVQQYVDMVVQNA